MAGLGFYRMKSALSLFASLDDLIKQPIGFLHQRRNFGADFLKRAGAGRLVEVAGHRTFLPSQRLMSSARASTWGRRPAPSRTV